MKTTEDDGERVQADGPLMEDDIDDLSQRQKVKRAEETDWGDLLRGQGLHSVEDDDSTPRGTPRLVISFLLCIAAIASVIVFGVFVVLSYISSLAEPAVSWYKELPSELPEIEIAETNTLYDADGEEFAEVWVEERRALDSLDEISDYAIDGLIATEDRRFYDHEGFDPIGTARSAVYGTGGGSGITQQLIKNLQFYDYEATDEERWDAIDPSLERKAQELKYAMRYENEHSKDEILLNYFNVVSFGGPDIYSIEAASRYFFDKPASDLELHEASVLVGSVQNTSLFNLQDPDAEENYKARQSIVLQRMVAEGMITQDEADEAVGEELEFAEERSRSGGCGRSDYPFFCEYVMESLREDPAIGEDEEQRNAVVARGGLDVYTTMDADLMDQMQEEVEDALGNDNRVTMPSVMVEPGTGGVQAFAFNREYGSGDDATEINLADRETGSGSAFKMVTLAAALHEGYDEDDLEFSSACPWTHPNFDTPDGGFRNSVSCEMQGGFLDYKEATAWSSNTWFVELQSQIGIPAVADMARSMGLDGDVGERSASYTLGPQGNTPIDMAAAFATFAADGVYCPASPITSYEYADGSQPSVPDNYDPADVACERVMSPHDAGIVLQAMRANTSDEVDDALGADAEIEDYDAVGKSGTNQLLNQIWGMVSDGHALYANAYDFERPTREIDNYFSDGEVRPWNDNTAQRVGARMMENALDGEENVELNYESDVTEIEPIPVDRREFITVPSALGMEPDAALSIFEGTGLTVNVDKDSCQPDEEKRNQYPVGVVVDQSVDAGEELPRGTETEIVLCTKG